MHQNILEWILWILDTVLSVTFIWTTLDPGRNQGQLPLWVYQHLPLPAGPLGMRNTKWPNNSHHFKCLPGSLAAPRLFWLWSVWRLRFANLLVRHVACISVGQFYAGVNPQPMGTRDQWVKCFPFFIPWKHCPLGTRPSNLYLGWEWEE